MVLFILTFVCIVCTVVFIVLMSIIVKPLSDHIFEEIFLLKGTNLNQVKDFKARSAFYGAHKVDLITHMIYINTFAFLCYDLTLQNNLKDVPYWCVLGGFSLIALLNNIHGHYIMQTTAGSFNTKFYFFTRSILQVLYIYLSLTLVLKKTLKWKELEVSGS